MSWRERIGGNQLHGASTLVGVVDVTAALLRIASDHAGQARVDQGSPELSAEQDRLQAAIDEILVAAFGKATKLFIDIATFNAICAALDSCTLREGFAAFSAAEMIDRWSGRLFIDAFRSRRVATLEPGAPFPVVPFPCDRLPSDEQKAAIAALKKRTGNPRTRRDPVDSTHHLRLAPAEVGKFRVRMVWADEWLPPVRTATRFAFGVTNIRPIGAEHDWKQYVVGTKSCFYGVVPKSPKEQEQRIEEILREAAHNEASIVVLPELCITPEILSSLQTQGLLKKLPLVIAGSYHEHPNQGPGRNVCEVYARGERVHTHEKFSDFHFDPGDGGGRCHEHLRRADGTAGFDLLLGAHSTAVVLICKDAIGEAGDLIQKLGPTLVAIPAMSHDTDDFAHLAERLARDPQAFTLVACAGPNAHVIFGRPDRVKQVISESLQDTGLVLSDISGSHIKSTIRELYN